MADDDFGPNGVYSNIPRIDSRGRQQLPMFLRWNQDPVGNDATNLSSLSPDLQKVVAQARADNPNLNFVIGNGKRSAQDQDQAKSWGWSQVGSKDGGDANVHMQGNAVDLWGLDSKGRVQFDPAQQKQISQAMQAAAQKLGVGVNWGGNFKNFKDAPHFELAGGGSAASSGAPEGPTATNAAPAATPAPPRPSGTTITSTSLNPQGRDAIIRTVAAEADHPGGDAAVAAVIRNRLLSGQWGNTPESVVKYPGQFSAWNAVTGYGGGAGANSLVNISPNSSTYQRIGGVVDDVFSGNTPDPTKGALNFYAPGGMKGGQAPGWWSQVSNPIRIGAQWYGTAPGENARVTGPRPMSPTQAADAAGPPPPLPAPGALARPITPTPVQAPGPIDPSIIARGGTSPPIPDTPGMTINSNPIASLGGKIGDLAGTLQKDLGKSDEAQKPPDIKPDIPPAPGARNISPLLGNPQIYAQRMAALNQPLAWGGAPPGQMYGAGFGPQNQVYGTSLMSQLQMLSDPTWMNQMAGG